MSGPTLTIIQLDRILSRYESTNIEVITQDLNPLSKPSLLELTAKIKRGPFEIEKLVKYFVKLCEQDTKVKIRVDLLARFGKEVDFYRLGLPAITKFQAVKGVFALPYHHLFPKCIGVRVSADRKKHMPDETGVLILENLMLEGYTSPDATEGILSESCRLVLNRLAHMHVTPLAMRIFYQHFFKESVLPCVLAANQQNKIPRLFNYMNNILDGLLDLNYPINPYMRCIKRAIEESKRYTLFGKPLTDDTWVTICHSNLSKSHLMLKYDDNGKPISCKILDLQMIEYSHCLDDLIYFLFTSVDSTYLDTNFHTLVCYYYDCFIDSLAEFELNSGPYNIKNFYEQLNMRGPKMIIKILQALAHITCEGYQDDGEPVLGSRFKHKLCEALLLMIVLGWIET